jgi:chromosome segregation ATPase
MQVVRTLRGMGQRSIERRLRETGDRLRRLREELRIVDEQLQHLNDEAEDMGLRALVSETPGADIEYRDARRHRDAMQSHRNQVVAGIAELEAKQDSLLERLSKSSG